MFTDDLKQSLATARSEAHRLHHASVSPEHLALGILRTAAPAVSDVLRQHAPADLAAELEQRTGAGVDASPSPIDLPYARSAKDALERAMQEARAIHDAHGTGAT